VCDPSPAALAGALRRLMEDHAAAERMGAAAQQRGARLSWAETVGRLTS
jgi:glycosyltransferase involved in cell wall biosynthesis